MDYQLSDFNCCPRCTTSESEGRVVNEDCFIEAANVWLKYVKCLNCGWRHEVKAVPNRKAVVLK
jgi:hypothetical protein